MSLLSDLMRLFSSLLYSVAHFIFQVLVYSKQYRQNGTSQQSDVSAEIIDLQQIKNREIFEPRSDTGLTFKILPQMSIEKLFEKVEKKQEPLTVADTRRVDQSIMAF